MPPVTTHDEPCPLFHFWRHQLWPKLASSILNFCRWKRSFQWYPDQNDWLNGAWNMHKNAQKFEWKTQSKIRATTRGYSRVKIACLDDAFSDFFELEASPVEGQSLQQKDKKRTQRKGKKKKKKLKKKNKRKKRRKITNQKKKNKKKKKKKKKN